MNIVRNGILLVSKLIKVKDKVDKILKKWPIDKVIIKYIKKVTQDAKDANSGKKIFMGINSDAEVLKSPFIFYPLDESKMKDNPNEYNIVTAMEVITSNKMRDRIASRGEDATIKKLIKKFLMLDRRSNAKIPMNLGLFKKVKLILT